MKYLTTLLVVLSTIFGEATMLNDSKKTVKTYLPFTLPVDPANVRTLVDLDLSYALADTLVGWSSTRELVSGLAESWKPTGEKEITFILSHKAKWSDGSDITADQVVKSLLRAKRAHSDSLKTLFELIVAIEARNSRTVVFKLNESVEKSGIVRKLTEPMYGIVSVNENESLNLKKTTGAFTLVAMTTEELTLVVNKTWMTYRSNIPDAVVIRRPPPGDELQDSFLKDSWANLLGATSLITKNTAKKYEDAHYTVWHRDLDKVFFLAPSPKLANEDGRTLLKFLGQNINHQSIVRGLSGFTLTDQFFPNGYVLFDPEFQKKTGKDVAPKEYMKRPLIVLGAQSRLSVDLQENLAIAIKESLGVKPKFQIVPLNEFEKARAAGEYDILAGALPVNDPNVEGAMGFFFGLTPPIIANAGIEEKNFGARVVKARKFEDQVARNLEYRKIFTLAVQEGTILPLFHYSTIVIAKEGIDLSLVPTTDETVAFSKVRFK